MQQCLKDFLLMYEVLKKRTLTGHNVSETLLYNVLLNRVSKQK